MSMAGGGGGWGNGPGAPPQGGWGGGEGGPPQGGSAQHPGHAQPQSPSQQPGYPAQGGYPAQVPPQGGYPAQGGFPPQGGYPAQGGPPPQGGFPPQGGYPQHVPAAGLAHTECQACGRRAPVKQVTLMQNVGLLVIRFPKTLSGALCKRCISSNFWSMTLITFFFGWWGVISFFYSLVSIPMNIVHYLGSLGMDDE